MPALVLLSLALVLVHLLAYTLGLRHLAVLKTERGIFLYHTLAYFAGIVTIACAASIGPRADALPAVVFHAGMGGIYSLSFLELWALSQRSYSLCLLDSIGAAPTPPSVRDLGSLQSIGVRKQELRNEDVKGLGLIHPDGRLTSPGRWAARLLRAILWISNGRTMN